MSSAKKSKANAPWVSSHLGTVTSVKRWSDTHVSTSGGGGVVHPKYGGYVAPPSVHSHVVQKQEVFSRGDDGREKSFVFDETNVPLREGSRLLAVWGSQTGADTGPYLHIENLDTGQKYTQPIRRLRLGAGVFNGLGRALLALVVVAPISLAFVPSVDDFLNQDADRLMAHRCPYGTIKHRVGSDHLGYCEAMGGTFTLEKHLEKQVGTRKINYYEGSCACPSADVGRQVFRQNEYRSESEGWGSALAVARPASDKALGAWRLGMAAVFFASWVVFWLRRSSKFNAESKKRYADFAAAVARAVAEAHDAEQRRKAAVGHTQ